MVLWSKAVADADIDDWYEHAAPVLAPGVLELLLWFGESVQDAVFISEIPSKAKYFHSLVGNPCAAFSHRTELPLVVHSS